MKILYLHQYFKFPNESGGTRSYDLATSFIKLGYQVEMITLTSVLKYKSDKRWLKVEQDGITIHYIYLPYGNHLSYFKRSLVFFQFLWFSSVKLMSLKGDLVLATSTPLTIGIPALLKKWIQKTPFIFETRDVWPEAVIAIGAIKNKILQKLLYKLEGLIYKNAVGIVPLSVDMKHSIVSRYPELSKKPITVIENISEVNRFQNEYNTDRAILKSIIGYKPRFTILYAGTFGKVNGISYVINLANELIKIDPTIVFVLIGNGAEKDIIIQEAKDKDIFNKNIFVMDAISKENLPQLYYESSMGSSFVIPIKELWANSANKFFDTLAANKPILINHKGWQKDIINEKNIGYVLPEKLNDFEIKKFVSYTNNQALIKRQELNSLNVAKSVYSLEVAVAKYLKIIKLISFENV